MLSAEIYLWEDHAKADKNLFKCVFSTLYIISTTIDNMHKLAFCRLNYPAIYSLSERESGCTHARNCVDLSKIENSFYYQELVTSNASVLMN